MEELITTKLSTVNYIWGEKTPVQRCNKEIMYQFVDTPLFQFGDMFGMQCVDDMIRHVELRSGTGCMKPLREKEICKEIYSDA